MRIRDPGWKKFGSGMKKIRIRDKHPGSATLVFIHIFLQTTSVEHPELFNPDPNPGPSGSGSYPLNQANKMRYLNWQIFYVHNGTAARLFPYNIYKIF
jgi:hypothetical protein